ncbi:MAG: SDR family NAD(P)-dependent oxidoreductase [Chloroflexi bacterium]|nr:SDR family NAD(P)-dependent oxidoreductase [Chloroflexota bacterium]
MAKYLLTGAAGFIGSFVAQKLLDNGDTILGIDNLNDAYDVRLKQWRLERLRSQDAFHYENIDIQDRERLDRFWKEYEFEAVINLAARAGVRQSISDPEIYFRTNVNGTLNLLELCQRYSVSKFVQASTSSLYAKTTARPFREDANVGKPLSPYAASKGAAEMLCHSYHHLYNIDITILRYFTVFGPAGRPDMSIFRFVQWVTEGRPVVIFGDGKQERDFTFVEDIAAGTVSALGLTGFEVINLGSDSPVQLLEVLGQIEDLIGKKASIDWQDEQPADVRATWAHIEKARGLLQWEPRTNLADGLRACINWYDEQRSWAKDVRTIDG